MRVIFYLRVIGILKHHEIMNKRVTGYLTTYGSNIYISTEFLCVVISHEKCGSCCLHCSDPLSILKRTFTICNLETSKLFIDQTTHCGNLSLPYILHSY